MVYRIILALSIVFFFSLWSHAQQAASGLVVTSEPPGAEVVLEGEVTIAGLTPVSFAHGIDGRYKIIIKKYGYESYKSIVYIKSDKAMSLSVRLKPKTRLKALARSAVFPGWGQFYTEQNHKAGIFLTMAIGAVSWYFIADSNFDDKDDHYRSLLSEYRRLTTYEDKAWLYPYLSDARKEAYDSESTRRIAIGTVVAVWGINLLDLLFHFPAPSGFLEIEGISLVPNLESGGVQLTLFHNF